MAVSSTEDYFIERELAMQPVCHRPPFPWVLRLSLSS